MRRILTLGLVCALCAALVAGCATRTEYLEVSPECTVPPQPSLPTITGDELAGLPDSVYWKLERREKRLTDWAMEMSAALREICEDDEPS